MYVQLPTTGTVIETADASVWSGAKRLTNKEGAAMLQAEALEYLHKLFPVGTTVWTKVTHVARSGMSRRIQVYAIKDNQPINVSAYVGRVIGERVNRDELSLCVSGCGMDMCFHTVYNLGRALYPDGFKVEGRGRNGDTSGHDNDGGYALNKRDM